MMENKDRSIPVAMDELSGLIIGAAIEVHQTIGPGLLESVYQECLAHELVGMDVRVEKEVTFPVRYKGLCFDSAFRMDLLVDERVAIELKAVDRVIPVHKAQLLSYLKMTGLSLGLLINFNVPRLTQGVTRVVNKF